MTPVTCDDPLSVSAQQSCIRFRASVRIIENSFVLPELTRVGDADVMHTASTCNNGGRRRKARRAIQATSCSRVYFHRMDESTK